MKNMRLLCATIACALMAIGAGWTFASSAARAAPDAAPFNMAPAENDRAAYLAAERTAPRNLRLDVAEKDRTDVTPPVYGMVCAASDAAFYGVVVDAPLTQGRSVALRPYRGAPARAPPAV